MEPASRNDNMVIVGTNWSSGAASVRERRVSEQSSRLEPLVGLRLAYRAGADSPRHCLGHVPFRRASGDYVDCTNRPEPGSRKCASCAIVDATFASNLHHAHTRGQAELDPAVVEHLAQPNVLYVAAFRDLSVKVGTSTEVRAHKRLAEQGAWRAVLVARADDGVSVRRIEDAVTELLDVPQSVSMTRKLEGMVRPRRDDAIEARLDQLAGDVVELVGRSGDPALVGTRTRWSFPGSDDDLWSNLHPYPLKLESGAHDIEVLAACGRLVVIGRPGADDRFVADLGRLYGIELDIGDHRPDALAVQDSLF